MKILLFLLAAIASKTAHADFVNLQRIHARFMEHFKLKSGVKEASLAEYHAHFATTFEQRVNHFDPSDSRTFKQRYYINSMYYKDSGPVFIYIGGESQLRSSAVERGSIVELAKQHNGLILALEHRFYGESHPFDLLTVENLKYLSSEQALHDLAHFIQQAPSLFPDFRLNADTKWVSVGGSYPGNLSAWFRLKFPHLVVASWASSAPVFAKSDYFEYDQVVGDSLGEECSQFVRNVNAYLEDALTKATSDDEKVQIKNLFHPTMGKDVVDDISFMYVLADIVAYAVQYDNPGVGLRDRLCKSPSAVQEDAVERFAAFTNYFFVKLGTSPKEMDVTAYNSPVIKDPSENMRQWMWQSCSEFGYFQSAPAQNPLRSKWITAEWHERVICSGIFGFPDDYRVPADETNGVYGGRQVYSASSRILFTNGSRDPWKALGIQKVNSKPSLNSAKWSQKVFDISGRTDDKCSSYLIQGVGHCSDLHGETPEDPQDLKITREKIYKQFKEWLK